MRSFVLNYFPIMALILIEFWGFLPTKKKILCFIRVIKTVDFWMSFCGKKNSIKFLPLYILHNFILANF